MVDNLDDATEALKFADSVTRFKAHRGDYAPHPAFGRMSHEALEGIHASHAAHHLRFLEPHPVKVVGKTG